MLEVKVTITLAPEVLNLLSGFAGGIKAFKPEQGKMQSSQNVKTYEEPEQNVEAEQPKKEESKSIDSDKQDESTESTETTETAVPNISIEEIRAVTAKAAKKDKPAVKGLLAKYEAKSVSVLSKEHYVAFYKEVKGLV
ncbi:hypothetical protein [Vallitalea sp.]|jgi:hypothetical protein|uniref:hypothetical protein n=1 Tax=Vallitalea sp. TaxID=1882829 RepID=UPI0025F11624|nr:hypothetical protein [Vallitalea sp.]MCT4686057.1 hypothetical protein [Vallitalea sp.]